MSVSCVTCRACEAESVKFASVFGVCFGSLLTYSRMDVLVNSGAMIIRGDVQ